MSTNIEWATDVWNPITGCPGPKVSPGCAHCYAERMATTRLRGRMGYDAADPFKVTYHHDRYEAFLRARTHKRIFVNSMGDLFHPDVDQHELDCVFAAMLANEITTGPSHDFMILTKRPDIMAEYFAPGPDVLLRRWGEAGNGWIHVGDGDEYFSEYAEPHTIPQPDHERYPNLLHKHLWPLPNIWLGGTVCNQTEADAKIPVLLSIPAAKHFVSVEPMLGDISLTSLSVGQNDDIDALRGIFRQSDHWNPNHSGCAMGGKIDWVICGGETGPSARPMHPDWVRGLRDQCAAAHTPFFFKGWGEWCPRFNHDLCGMDDSANMVDPTENRWKTQEVTVSGETDLAKVPYREVDWMTRVGKRRSGRMLDGLEYSHIPEE